jgi:hypothetical protein
MKPQIEIVQWIDSGLAISDGWMDHDEIVKQGSYEHMLAETVGYWVHEDENVLILSHTYDEALDAHLNVQVIAISAIQNRLRVRNEQ